MKALAVKDALVRSENCDAFRRQPAEGAVRPLFGEGAARASRRRADAGRRCRRARRTLSSHARGAASGAGVVVLSSDAVELQGLCDRVLVFSRGSVVRTLKDDEITEESITGAAIGADTARRRSAAKGDDRAASIRRLLSGDYSPTLVLVALIVALGLYTASVNGKFLSERSISSLLFLASALAFVSMGQLIVLLTGGIDLSVGSMTALVVVVLSFFAGEHQGASQLALGLVLAFGTAALVGVINGVLIRGIGLSSVITTISTFIALQGVALLLRSTPDGYYSSSVTDALTAQIGPIPIAFIVAVGVVAISEVILRRSRFGMELRAVGSNEVAAYRLGARVNRTIILAYVLCSLFAGVGGLLLAGQVGVGDPSRRSELHAAEHFGGGSRGRKHIWRARFVPRRLGGSPAHPGDHQRHRLSRPRYGMAILVARWVDPVSGRDVFASPGWGARLMTPQAISPNWFSTEASA